MDTWLLLSAVATIAMGAVFGIRFERKMSSAKCYRSVPVLNHKGLMAEHCRVVKIDWEEGDVWVYIGICYHCKLKFQFALKLSHLQSLKLYLQ